METIVVAIIVGLVGPGVIAVMTATFLRSSERQKAELALEAKQHDWDRQDEVAKAAAKAAADQLAETRRSATLAEDAITRIGEVHDIVNSDRTMLLEFALGSVRRELVLLELAPKSRKRTAAITVAETSIEDLEKQISEAHRLAELANIKTDEGEQSNEMLENIDSVGTDTNQRVRAIEEREEEITDRISDVEEKTDR